MNSACSPVRSAKHALHHVLLVACLEASCSSTSSRVDATRSPLKSSLASPTSRSTCRAKFARLTHRCNFQVHFVQCLCTTRNYCSSRTRRHDCDHVSHRYMSKSMSNSTTLEALDFLASWHSDCSGVFPSFVLCLARNITIDTLFALTLGLGAFAFGTHCTDVHWLCTRVHNHLGSLHIDHFGPET